VGDDPHREVCWIDGGDGEADAVDRDGSFVNHIAGKFLRERDIDAQIRSFFFQSDNLGGAINMTLDKMTAEPSVHP
jgi:hypothetical protein